MALDEGEGTVDVFFDPPDAPAPPAPLWAWLLGAGACTACSLKSGGDPAADEGDTPVQRVTGDDPLPEREAEEAGSKERIQRSPAKKQSLLNSLTNRASGFFGSFTGNNGASPPSDGMPTAEDQACDIAGTESENKSMKLLFNVNKAVRAFQKSTAAKESGPSDVELARGVQVEMIYEFFDPASRRTRLRKMNEDVLHRRRRTDRKSTAGEMQIAASVEDYEVGSSEDGDVGLLSPRSSSSSATAMSSQDEESDAHEEAPPKKSNKFLRRQFTSSNTEVVTKWAALVGRVLHAKVLDFAALKSKAMRHRFQVGNSTSSNRMVGRMQSRARMVVKQARGLAKRLSQEPDCFDAEWNDPSLLSYLFSTEYLDTLMLIPNVVCKLLSSQPALAVAHAPCKIFGDIHGQLRDLLLIIFAFGSPSEGDDTHWVFNGDFVDRGAHQLEVVGLLLSLKVLFPDRVWLVRGNHEDRSMNERYGFLDACNKSLGGDFGPKVFELIQGCFDRLPLACLVQDKILCVHGGIGDGTWKLDDLRTIPRPLVGEAITHPSNSWIFNILWSDPIEDGKDADPHVFGVHESPRGGVAAQFAWNITKTFCARNGLSLIVRSHQSKRGSRGFDVMHENMLVRVFSARDYEGHGNDGAVLKVTTKVLDGHTMLVVRPQVVRSAKKSRDEEKSAPQAAKGEGARRPPSPTGPPTTTSPRGGAGRRVERVRSGSSAKEGRGQANSS